jgi:tight adherence protein B
MLTLVISIAVFVCVATLVGALALMFRGDADSAVAERLSALTGGRGKGTSKKDKNSESAVLSQPLEGTGNSLEDVLSKLLNLQRFIDQSGVNVTPSKLMLLSMILGGAGVITCIALPQVPMVLAPILFPCLACLPFPYLVFMRKRRLKKFGAQLPEALELISRALRAGHSLGSGIQLVASEMDRPLSTEFARAHEEQNLGITLEDSLESLTERVPNLDLRFFATAVILQRQTGGDLAEILDKIGHLIRERFTIWGQIQALTGEGRLSGIVLLALPPLLFLAIYKLNQGYVMKLFEDPLGHKMLAVAVIMQILGAVVIKKIVNIKV